jgi:hypothetical protein
MGGHQEAEGMRRRPLPIDWADLAARWCRSPTSPSAIVQEASRSCWRR